MLAGAPRGCPSETGSRSSARAELTSMPADPTAPSPLSGTSALVPSILDRIRLPRLTFSWPGLELLGCSPSAEPFVRRPGHTANLFSAWLPTDPAPPTFAGVFRPPSTAEPVAPQDWVRTLLAQCDRGQLEDEVLLRAFHFNRPVPATLFLARADDADGAGAGGEQDVLHVLLLGPGRPKTHALAADAPPQAVERMGATPAAVAGQPMSSGEVGELLWAFTAGTLDESKGQTVLNETELRMVLDEMPEIAFMLNNDGTASWFNKQVSTNSSQNTCRAVLESLKPCLLHTKVVQIHWPVRSASGSESLATVVRGADGGVAPLFAGTLCQRSTLRRGLLPSTRMTSRVCSEFGTRLSRRPSRLSFSTGSAATTASCAGWCTFQTPAGFLPPVLAG